FPAASPNASPNPSPAASPNASPNPADSPAPSPNPNASPEVSPTKIDPQDEFITDFSRLYLETKEAGSANADLVTEFKKNLTADNAKRAAEVFKSMSIVQQTSPNDPIQINTLINDGSGDDKWLQAEGALGWGNQKLTKFADENVKYITI